jgi:trk system potassium uptake protein TrkA
MARMQFAVIGLGTFGLSVCRALHDLGHEVLAVDDRAEVVREVAALHVATHVVQADGENMQALRELDIRGFDAVVVARGTDLEAAVLTTLNLVELGVSQVIAKAVNERHARVLERVGGERTRVVVPEADMGLRLAYQLSGHDLVEAVWVDPNFAFAERPLPAGLVGKTLAEAAVQAMHGVVPVGLRRGGQLVIAPELDFKLAAGDRLVLLGRTERVQAFGR